MHGPIHARDAPRWPIGHPARRPKAWLRQARPRRFGLRHPSRRCAQTRRQREPADRARLSVARTALPLAAIWKRARGIKEWRPGASMVAPAALGAWPPAPKCSMLIPVWGERGPPQESRDLDSSPTSLPPPSMNGIVMQRALMALRIVRCAARATQPGGRREACHEAKCSNRDSRSRPRSRGGVASPVVARVGGSPCKARPTICQSASCVAPWFAP